MQDELGSGAQLPGEPGPASDVDIAGWIQAGWKLFISDLGVAVGVTLLLVVPAFFWVFLAYFTMFVTAVFTAPHAHAPQAVPIAMGIVLAAMGLLFACVMPAMRAGVYACFREGIRTGRLTAAPLWSGFRHWWACTWVAWVLGLAALLCIPLIFVFLIGLPLLWAIGTLGWLALFRIVDKGQGGFEALTFAWNALRGRLWMMLVFSLLVGALAGVGVMGMYVGLLFTIPIGIAAYAAGYEALRRKVEGA